jgi:hypothetical protein
MAARVPHPHTAVAGHKAGLAVGPGPQSAGWAAVARMRSEGKAFEADGTAFARPAWQLEDEGDSSWNAVSGTGAREVRPTFTGPAIHLGDSGQALTALHSPHKQEGSLGRGGGPALCFEQPVRPHFLMHSVGKTLLSHGPLGSVKLSETS